MTNSGMATLLFVAALSAGSPALSQTSNPAPPTANTRFKCVAGGDVTAQFATQDTRLVAIVDAGEGPHALPHQPWTGGPPKLTWSDGQRTLTWSPGVQIMWVDGPTHRMCGRPEHRH